MVSNAGWSICECADSAACIPARRRRPTTAPANLRERKKMSVLVRNIHFNLACARHKLSCRNLIIELRNQNGASARCVEEETFFKSGKRLLKHFEINSSALLRERCFCRSHLLIKTLANESHQMHSRQFCRRREARAHCTERLCSCI